MSLNKLIELSEKKTELLKEIKSSLEYEKCTHELIKIPLNRLEFIFVVYDIKSGKEVFENKDKSKVDEWLNRRVITKVYIR